MSRVKKIYIFYIVGGVVALLLLAVGAIFFFPIQVKLPVLRLDTDHETIIFTDSSSLVDIHLDEKRLYEIYFANVSFGDEKTRAVYEPIYIELTDEKQGLAYSWEDGRTYESISISKLPSNGKRILISVAPTVLSENGWSKKSIEQEIETLLLQGVITLPTPTLTSSEIEANQLKAGEIQQKIRYTSFVELQ